MDTLILTCPHCFAANRIPTAKLGASPNCGRCHRALFVGAPLALDEPGFDSLVLKSELPVIVDFWAPWCGPCIQFAPTYAAAAKRLEPRMRLGKVDTEAQPQLAARFAIRSIPTIAVFKEGRELARISGARTLEPFVQWASQFQA